MKNRITLAVIALTMSNFAFSQVGVNTADPKATFDIAAKFPTAAGLSRTVDGLLIPRVDRQRALLMQNVPNSTLIYVNAINGGASGSVINVDAVGFYYYDDTKSQWVKLNSGSVDTSIYANDGTLAGNRKVTQGANTLAFEGTAQNAFSVDGSTFSVDASNDRVGIGATAPKSKLHVVNNTTSAITGNVNSTTGIIVSSNSKPGISFENTATASGSRVFTNGVANVNGNGSLVWQSVSDDGATAGKQIMSMQNTGFVGIGTAAPTGKFEIVSDNEGSAAENDFYFRGFGNSKYPGLFLTSANGTNASPTNLVNGDGIGRIAFIPRFNNAYAYTQGSGMSAYYRGNGTNNLTDLSFMTSMTDRMKIDENGNVGIGNLTPANTLDVKGSFKLDNGTQGANKVLTSDANGVATWQTPAATANTNIYTDNGTLAANRTVAQADKTLAFTSTATTGTSHFTVDGTTLNVDAVNNRVGLGTATPTNPLDVRSATAGAVKIVDGTQGNNKVLTSDATGIATWKDLPAATVNTNIYTDNGTLTANRTVAQADKTLAFTSTATTGTSHFTVDGTTLNVDAVNNRIGIGTASPQNRLDLGSGNGRKLALWNSAAGDDFYGLGNAANVLQLYAGATATENPIMTLTNTDRVGIGTTSPETTFHTIGTRRFENATAGTVAVGSVLTATDKDGTAEWRTPATETVVGGMDSGAGIDIPFATNSAFRYTGRYITLPPGRWAVTITQLAQTLGALDNDDAMFIRSTFAEGTMAVGATATQSANVTGGPSLMSFRIQGPASAGHLQQFDVYQGTVFINNNTAAPKTYRYIVGNTVTGGGPNAATVIKGYGSNWSESSIFATAIK